MSRFLDDAMITLERRRSIIDRNANAEDELLVVDSDYELFYSAREVFDENLARNLGERTCLGTLERL